jgi:D-alanine transfer protein
LILALLLCSLVLKFAVNSGGGKTITVRGGKISERGLLVNLRDSVQQELELLGSLRDKNGITLMGSSELTTESAYIPYTFMPDSLGIRLNAFGHAHHQTFAIYCQLLAMREELKGAKVCILLSPGWYESEGTNIEAFLEFVRPNFLKKIISDKAVPDNAKKEIGKFLSLQYDLIDSPSSEIRYLTDFYKYADLPVLGNYFKERAATCDRVNYVLTANKQLPAKKTSYSWDKNIRFLEEKFVASVKSNSRFINDEYFKLYVKQADGTLLSPEFTELNTKNNRELQDLYLLVDLLKKSGAEPCFIMQGMNPHHYQHLDRFDPVLKEITALLEKNNFPFLNLFVSNKKEYKPGTLNDVMHMGDVGWLKMNRFLYTTYYE